MKNSKIAFFLSHQLSDGTHHKGHNLEEKIQTLMVP